MDVRKIFIKDEKKTRKWAKKIKGGDCGPEEQVQVKQVKQSAGSQHEGTLTGPQPSQPSYASPDPSSWLTYPSNLVPPHIKPQMGGDVKHIKVELKKKTIPKRVHLNQKKTAPSKKQTKKVRKVTLGVSTFHKRITRAKKLHKKVKELPLDKLKEKLVKDGLIKATSKAPESVLRQIASDAAVVNKRAL